MNLCGHTGRTVALIGGGGVGTRRATKRTTPPFCRGAEVI
jgi:hypothetical protein